MNKLEIACIIVGFVFTRYLAHDYHEFELETVFLKETAEKREVIDFLSLFKE